MAAPRKKVIITCAVTGAIHTPTMSRYLPVTPEEITDHFEREYPDAVPLMPSLVEDYQYNPVGLLATLHTDPWQADAKVALIGDAAHLFTPTGGLGYNTGVEDAVNLGWKLAAVHHGQSPDALLSTYALERKPIGQRNTGYSRQFADSVGLYPATEALEEDSPAGVAARAGASFHERSNSG